MLPFISDAEHRYRLLVENLADYAIFMIDVEGRISTWNEGAQRIIGYAESEIIGQPIALIFTPEDRGRGIPEQEINGAVRDGRAIDERWHLCKDGSRFFASGVLTAVRNEGGDLLGFAKLMRDNTERKRAESRLLTEHAVSSVLAQATTLDQTVPAILEAVCRSLGWQCGAMWTVDALAQHLRWVQAWCDPSCPVPQFEQMSERMPLSPGVGLPGRVWATGKPAWIADVVDDDNFPRRPSAVRAGLHGAVAFPICAGDELLGVMEFFSPVARPPEQPLQEMMAVIGRQVGQFILRRRAEEALVRSEARTAAILYSALDCIVSMSHDGRITEWNPAAEQTFGYTREEVLGRMMAEVIIPPALQDAHRAGLARYLATGEHRILGQRVELTAMRRDGSEFPIELTITRMAVDGPPAFTGQIRDITAQREAQAEVDRGRHLFERIAEATPDVLSLFDVQSNKLLYTNREIAAMLGYSPEEIAAMGESVLATVIHPEDMPRINAVIQSLDALPQDQVTQCEYRARHKNGSYLWMLSRSVVFSRGPGGKAHVVLGLAQDITERKRYEEVLRESEERLRLGLAAGNTGTWDWDIVTNAVTWSERVYEFHGVKPGEFGGTLEEFARIVHPDDVERVQAAIQQSVQSGAPYEIEFRVRHGNGDVRWLTTNGRVFRDDADQPVRMLGATSDITERKLAEQERDRLLESERAARGEAERASRLKDEFLATVSHELRTPLTAILGYAQLMQHALNDPREIAEGLAVIERNARTQQQLIEDILDMSRIISGKLRLDVQRVGLRDVIEAALETVRPAADAKGIRLIKTIDTSASAVSGDPARLQQVFWNLLNNAIKFTPKLGRVHVILERINSHLEIAVSDTGQGINAEFLPYVFDKFRQADASAARKHGGLGIGLALVKSLVELHGGTVWARSSGEGNGATFVVALPLTAMQLEPPETDRQHPTSPRTASFPDRPSLAGIVVLAVDDEPDARALVRRFLEECGARVLSVSSALEALAVLDNEPVDVILSDIGMPDVDGYELMRRIRQRGPERGGNTPAAVLTAFARSEDRIRALMAGYQTHIAKPVEPAELVAAVASLTRQAPRR